MTGPTIHGETWAERVARVQAERVAQGLPPKANDPLAMAVTAAVIRNARKRDAA